MSFGKTTLEKAGYAVFSAAFMAATIGLQSVAALELAQSSPAPSPASPSPVSPSPVSPAPAAPAPPAAQQTTDTPVYERSSYINSCRAANTTTEIFLNTALGPVDQRVGTINSGAQVTLTGVLGDIPGVGGVAQIKTPVVGWLASANLTSCNSGGTQTKGACYFIKLSTAPNGLFAYDDPTTKQKQLFNGQADGPAGGSRVYFIDPAVAPQTVGGVTFVKVFYTSLSGNDRIGWISQGSAGTTPGSATSNFKSCN
jgi:hypothetical protein